MKKKIIIFGAVIVLLLLAAVFIVSVVSADKRSTIPKILPIGSNVRAIVINQVAGQTDPFNKDNNNFILFVEFQDIDSTASETHYIEVTARMHLTTKEMHNDIVAGIETESDMLGYNLVQVFVTDYTAYEVK